MRAGKVVGQDFVVGLSPVVGSVDEGRGHGVVGVCGRAPRSITPAQ